MRMSLPSWSEYRVGIQTILETAVKRAGIPAVAPISGSRTSLEVNASEKTPAVKMPYLKVWLTGWAPVDVQQKTIEKDYTIVGTKAIGKCKTTRDNLVFNISIYSKKHSEVVDITQAIISYLGITGTLSIVKSGTTYEVPYSLSDYVLDVIQENSGNISYYSTELSMQIQVTSERIRDDEVETTIQSVIVDTEAEIEEDGDEVLEEQITYE